MVYTCKNCFKKFKTSENTQVRIYLMQNLKLYFRAVAGTTLRASNFTAAENAEMTSIMRVVIIVIDAILVVKWIFIYPI